MLPQPDDVTAIAVIHPAQSAGWADVRAELERLQKRGIVRFASHPMPFEGRVSAAAIADALANIGQGELPDLVLIIRGGGAAAGLASLANLGLARGSLPLPGADRHRPRSRERPDHHRRSRLVPLHRGFDELIPPWS